MIEPRLDPAAAAPVFHGGPPALDGEDSRIQHDFSTNVNAFGPPPSVLHALAEADPATYPEPMAHAARAAFVRWSGLSIDRIALTAGACDAIDRIARAFLAPGDDVLIAAPAFGEYARAAAMAGATVHEVRNRAPHPASPRPPFSRRTPALARPPSPSPAVGSAPRLPRPLRRRRSPAAPSVRSSSPRSGGRPEDERLTARADPTVERILSAVRDVRPRLLFLAAPSSPLGAARPAQEIAALADAIRGHGLLVLDESYSAFATGIVEPPSQADRDEVVHVRSITKDFALAGVRAGFVVASPEIIRAIRSAGPPWAASAPAQAAAAATFTPPALDHVARTIAVLRSERARLAGAFAAHGAVPLPGDTHVLCLRVQCADTLATRIGRLGIRIRPCHSFGWPDVVRVAARSPHENDILIDRFMEAAC